MTGERESRLPSHELACALVPCAVTAVLALALQAGASELEPAPADLDARAIAQRSEDAMRSDRTYTKARMTVTSPRLVAPRVVAFESWADRSNRRTFIHIEKPAKDEGTAFLMLRPNLWMYVPRVERTMRLPPSMMLQSWMGSDFTNDDLVRSSSTIEDYDHRVLGIDPALDVAAGRRSYVVEYDPHEDAAVVWGRIVTWSDVERGTPYQQEFYDEDGEKLRVMRFSDVREVDGRFVPHRWTMAPLDKPGHKTEIVLEAIDFDAEIDEDVFTTRNLKRRR